MVAPIHSLLEVTCLSLFELAYMPKGQILDLVVSYSFPPTFNYSCYTRVLQVSFSISEALGKIYKSQESSQV